MILADAEERLARLAAQAREQIEWTSYAHRDWAPARNGVIEVLIVGAGQAGLATAFALARKDITNVLIVDASDADHVGPWGTSARMHTLRTPKRLKWADLGVPALTPHAWFEAKFGKAAWDDITFIPRLDWRDYLAWYRETLGLPVQFGTRVERVAPPQADAPDAPFAVTLSDADGTRTVLAQRVVFATGLEGAGGRNVPHELFGHLPSDRWAHTDDPIDFSRLRGLRVGVLGGGASAFDNAGCALEAGAASVHSFMRRPTMPSANPLRWMEFAGFLEHYADWDDAKKWAFTKRVLDVDQPTTQNSLWRCYAHSNFELSFSSPWLGTRIDGDEIAVDVAGTEHRFDFLIAGTGVAVDLTRRPELANVVDDIGLWRDRFTPPAGQEAPALGAYPYLTTSFAFTEKPGHRAPWLGRLFHFAQGARITMGITGHQLSGLPAGVDRLVWGITRDIFLERGDEILSDFFAYDTPELTNIGPRPDGAREPQTNPSSL